VENVVGRISKKNLEKHFKGVHKKKRKNKTLGKEVEEHVKSIAIKELEAHGDDGLEKIVIENVSIEIWSEDPEKVVASARSAIVASEATASTRCFYYCYVIGGRRICRKICW
jgi:3-deoxy-D-manno-octulosonate 8-phosphate phosphatase KdsC-like HAD superfamily phosphatase